MKKAVLGFLVAAAFVSLGDVNLPNTSTIADIQAAIDNAQPGEIITLADGTYLFDAPLTIEKGITLTGSHRDKCILQGSGKIDSISAMKIADAGACVKNLTITKVDSSVDDYQYHGIAVWITAGLFTQSRVTECKTSNGNRAAGVSLESDTAIMTHCIIDHNTASGGNGVGGVRIHKNGGTMANCLVWANTGGSGDYGVGGVSVKPDPWQLIKVVNCTIVGNTATKVGGGLRIEVDYFNANDPTKNGPWIVNTIIANNTAPDGADMAFNRDESKNYTGYNCLCPTVTYGVNPQTADPLFVDAENGDFHIQPASKARNKGDKEKAAAVLGLESLDGLQDFYGLDRVLEDQVDIGCSEFLVDPTQPTCVIAIDKEKPVAGDDVTLTAVVDGFGDADDIVCSWTILRTGDAEPVAKSGAEVVLKALDAGSYTATLVASSEQIGKSTEPAELTFVVLPKTLYVTSAENPGATLPYGSPETAATSLIEALKYAVAGATVELDAGTHNVSESVVIPRGITVRGAGRDQTTIYATTEFDPVVSLNGEGALLQGVTVAHGRVKTWWQQSGSGVVIGSDGGTMADCRVTDCGGTVSRIFGAVNISGSGALVTRCLIDSNFSLGSGSVCGGIFAKAGRIENCVITNNEGWASTYLANHNGSGLCLAGAVTVLNCTIIGNRMTEGHEGSGVHVESGSARVHNCIIDGNLSGDGTESNYRGNGASFSYCLSSSEAPEGSTGCIVGSPVFDEATPYLLVKDTPGWNQGSVVGYEDRLYTATDFYGTPRVKNIDIGIKDIDIGAVESSYTIEEAGCSIIRSEDPFYYLGSTVTLTGKAFGFGDADDIVYAWTISLDGEDEQIVTNEASIVLTPEAAGTYTVNLTASSEKAQVSASADPTTFVVKEPPAFFIGEQPYDTWTDAYSAAKAGDTITVGRDAEMTFGNVGLSITLDLCGHTLQWNAGGWMFGKITVIDSSAGDGVLTFAKNTRNVGGGTVDLSSLTSDQFVYSDAIWWTNAGTTILFPADMPLKTCNATYGNRIDGEKLVAQGVSYIYNDTKGKWKREIPIGLMIKVR